MAGKIWEIISSGQLRRLENVDQEREAVLSLFTKIHGVGLQTAQQLYAQVRGGRGGERRGEEMQVREKEGGGR